MSRFLTKILNEEPGEAKKRKQEAGLSVVDSPPKMDRPSTVDSPPTTDGPTTEHPIAYPMDRPSTMDRPSVADSPPTVDRPKISFLTSLPAQAGRLDLPHRYTDHACSQLSPDEQAVYLQLYRLSWGWGKKTCFISTPRLSERSNVPETTLRRVVKKLIAKDLVEILERKFGSKMEQGVLYRVSRIDGPSNPDGLSAVDGPSTVAPNKKNTQRKNTHTEPSEPGDKPSAARGVGVGSKFTIEECRRYAEHLRSTGQGINNPGGYATTIHRTGEADALVEAYLNPGAAASSVDSSSCPDCSGTGFYYPEGKEKGMAKCKHPRLLESSGHSDTPG